jgi:peptidylprolyl isomerase
MPRPRIFALVVLLALVSLAACGGGGHDGGAGAAGASSAAGAVPANAAGASTPALPASPGEVGVPDAARAEMLRSVAFRPLPNGHELADVEIGSGLLLEQGMATIFSYAIYLEDGTLVERTDPRVGPLPLRNIGSSEIPPHLNETLLGMKGGGVRRLRIASSAFFGGGGTPIPIPDGARVIVEIKAVDVQPAAEPPAFPDLSGVDLTTTASGLKWADLVVGDGAEITEGGAALVDYSGWLEDGTLFDTNRGASNPLGIENVGIAPVIEGWNQGLLGMKKGGRRLLVIPPGLGYGDEGSPPKIPPKATLVFIIDVVYVRAF